MSDGELTPLDEHIQEYIYQLLANAEISDEEVYDSIICFVEDEVARAHIHSRSAFLQQETQSHYHHQPTQALLPKSPETPKIQNADAKYEHDPDVKKKILERYDLVRDTSPSRSTTIDTKTLFQEDDREKRRVRYRNGVIVTTKGDKYV